MQMWVKEEQKYVLETLHTEDKEITINKAEEWFIFCRAKFQQGEKIFSITLDELRHRYYVIHFKSIAYFSHPRHPAIILADLVSKLDL
jgi:hypothetical protein